MSNPKVHVSQKSDPSKQQETSTKDSAGNLSEDQIRTRAYQIYEFRDRTANTPDGDWFQAETELTDLVSGK